MAEYDLTPIEVDYDLQGTYDLLKKYFLRENNPFNVTSDFINDEGFTIDFIRSYSFVASTYKATIHLAGFPMEDGRTILKLHAKSVDSFENIEKEVRDRIAETLGHMVEQKKKAPVVQESTKDTKKSDRRQLIILLIVAAIIIIGIMPWSCSEQFSRFWIF